MSYGGVAHSNNCLLEMVPIILSGEESCIMITVISVERYLAICHPLRYHMINTNNRCFKTVVLSWIVSLFVSSLAFLVCEGWRFGVREALALQTACLALLNVLMLLALIVTVTMYSKIIREMAKRGNLVSSETINQSIRKESLQVLRVAMANTIVFFVCMIPTCMVQIGWILRFWGMWRGCDVDSYTFLTIAEFARVLTLVNSAVNPWLYKMLSQKYREALRQAFSCRMESYVNCNIV
ncbi:growth hormone secretagogue receptor type 1-like [Ptychodera flava]|uniref:growth hormone secretagogue receptor type 1-like n=1 Tax=Ptychodera flava TaxID=63121 RepID=UPI00396A228C